MSDNRSNQDKYDVMQAREEFESIHDPALRAELDALTKRVESLVEQVKEIKEMLQ